METSQTVTYISSQTLFAWYQGYQKSGAFYLKITEPFDGCFLKEEFNFGPH
jgi:hypothetical protein